MRLSAVLLLVSLTAPAVGDAPRDGLAVLVGRLGSSQFEEREAAARALDAHGGAALGLLRIAMRSPDAEVRRRARDLVTRIERRLDTARVLRPTRLRLVYQDVPVAEAVDDFARRTGFPVALSGDRARLAGRRVTLDTGTVTFWEALARLEAAAGLAECEPAPAPPRAASAEETRARRFVVLDDALLAGLRPPLGVLLEDGRRPARPTWQAGALRIRALPPAAEGSKATITLDIQPESKLDWEALVSLRIDRAVDDRGRALGLPPAYVGGEPALGALGPGTTLLMDHGTRLPTNLGRRRVPVHLDLPPGPAGRLRELRGTLGAWVRTPPEAVVTVDGILRAAGRTERGRDDTRVRVTDVRSLGDGEYRVSVQVTAAPPVGNFFAAGQSVLRILNRGPRDRGEPDARASCPLTLLDAGGRPVRLTGVRRQGGEDDAPTLFTLTAQCARGQGEPARLVYTARRLAFIEVPFTLKDVPLGR